MINVYTSLFSPRLLCRFLYTQKHVAFNKHCIYNNTYPYNFMTIFVFASQNADVPSPIPKGSSVKVTSERSKMFSIQTLWSQFCCKRFSSKKLPSPPPPIPFRIMGGTSEFTRYIRKGL